MVMTKITVDELRKSYMKGTRKTGRVNVKHLGLKYDGLPITEFEFCLHAIVRYYSNTSNIAVFQDNCCLDD